MKRTNIKANIYKTTIQGFRVLNDVNYQVEQPLIDLNIILFSLGVCKMRNTELWNSGITRHN